MHQQSAPSHWNARKGTLVTSHTLPIVFRETKHSAYGFNRSGGIFVHAPEAKTSSQKRWPVIGRHSASRSSSRLTHHDGVCEIHRRIPANRATHQHGMELKHRIANFGLELSRWNRERSSAPQSRKTRCTTIIQRSWSKKMVILRHPSTTEMTTTMM